MIQKNLAVGVVDDGLLDNRRRYDVVNLLRNHHGLPEIFADGLVHVAHILGHVSGGERLPRLLAYKEFPDTLQAPHLIDESLHDDYRHHREQFLVILHIINLEDNKALVEKVDVLL